MSNYSKYEKDDIRNYLISELNTSGWDEYEINFDEIIYTQDAWEYLMEKGIDDFKEAIDNEFNTVEGIANYYYYEEQVEILNEILEERHSCECGKEVDEENDKM